METKSINKTAKKYLEIIARGIIEENELIAMKSFMNKSKENAEMLFLALNSKELFLSLPQNAKGYDFLMKQWKTPTGAERKNNPFGYREQNVLLNFSHFTLHSLYNAGIYVDYYVPLYIAHEADGSAFEYYYNRGTVNIMG